MPSYFVWRRCTSLFYRYYSIFCTILCLLVLFIYLLLGFLWLGQCVFRCFHHSPLMSFVAQFCILDFSSSSCVVLWLMVVIDGCSLLCKSYGVFLEGMCFYIGPCSNQCGFYSFVPVISMMYSSFRRLSFFVLCAYDFFLTIYIYI